MAIHRTLRNCQTESSPFFYQVATVWTNSFGRETVYEFYSRKVSENASLYRKSEIYAESKRHMAYLSKII